MAANKTWVEKADLVVNDFVVDGGYLNDEQSQEILELQVQESVLLGLTTVKPMKASRFEIPKLGFTGRVLRGAVENQALTEAERSKPVAAKTILDVQEFIAEVRIPYGALEDHVSQGTLMATIKAGLAKAIARDVEKVAINGDTTSPDTLLNKLDGFIKQLVSNTVAAGGVRLNKSPLKQMRQVMPSEYKRAPGNMVYLTSDNSVIDYGDSLASRGTVLGDTNILRRTNLEYGGSAVVPIPIFPEDLGGGTDETVAFLCDPKNMWVGIQRNLLIETAKDISARQWIIVVTMKFDVKWAHEPAAVLATGILASPAP